MDSNNTNVIPWPQFEQKIITIPGTQTMPSGFGAPFMFPKPTALSDSDIELMAICIANKHPQMEGHAGCFCAMKRLEKGISKD